MHLLAWIGAHWSGILGDVGIVAGLFFSGLGFWRESRVRRAATRIDIIKLHRELWTYFSEHPELAGLFDQERDMVARPLTSEEARFANLFFIHVSGTYVAQKAGSYSQPEMISTDLKETFAYPAISAAWMSARRLHDRGFVAFIERKLEE